MSINMTMTQKVFIVFILTFGSFCSGNSDNYCSPFEIKAKMFNKKLVGYSISEISVPGHHDCVKECMSLSVCKSTDYYGPQNTCKLNEVVSSSVHISEFVPQNGAIFSDISEWPSAMVGGCSSRPCKAHQRCIRSKENYYCLDITCKNVPSIENGKIQLRAQDKTTFRDTATVVCNAGYDPSQPSVKCQASGTWEQATCERVCQNVPSIENGQIQLKAPDENKFRDTATVVCNAGYDPSQPSVKCQASGTWEQATCEPGATDCKHILQKYSDPVSGLFDILLWNSGERLTVYCDMNTDNGGWTVFQKRFDGSTDFTRSLSEYVNGFGSVDGEYWLGLKYIQEIAKQGATELRIDMSKKDGTEGFETFRDFSLAYPDYTLNLGSQTGTPGLNTGFGMSSCKKYKFSTYDHDVDSSDSNCAAVRHGGWWYDDCSVITLNSKYCTPGTTDCQFEGLVHYSFAGFESLKTSRMMIRRVN